MDIRTGKIINQDELEKMDLEEQKHFVPLSKSEAKRLSKIEQSQRVSFYENNLRHKQKEKSKRRLKNKMRNKNRRNKK